MTNVNVEPTLIVPTVDMDLIKQKRAELRELNERFREQAVVRKEERKVVRAEQNTELENLKHTINSVLSICYEWNKLGKKAKLDFDVIERIKTTVGEIHETEND